MGTPFVKMHGLGNDFVIIDQRNAGTPPSKSDLIKIADRRWGVGCDQVLILQPAKNAEADLIMRIFNPDGSEAEACGNGTRSVAKILMAENGRDNCVIETIVGLRHCRRVANDMVEVDMWAPRVGWREIPLAEERDTLHVGNIIEGAQDPVAVNVGNPWAVFFVDDIGKVDVAGLGPRIENHPLFPERTNVQFTQILSPERIRVRFWERGAGITQACGSGTCATIVAAVRRGLTERKAEIVLDGGSLFLEWREADGHILMTGPATHVFNGVWEADV